MAAVASAAAMSFLAPALAACFPEGPPWDALDRPEGEACAQCHFGATEIRQSPALVLEVPPDWTPAHSVPVMVTLTSESRRAGFLLVARDAEGRPAGRFAALDGTAEVSGEGHAARQTELGSVVTEGAPASWALLWHPPAADPGPVTFFAAAVAGNDDASPFGDEVHRREVTLCAGC